jgi:hypothetical protein
MLTRVMLRHGFLAVNGKRKEVVTEGKKLAFLSTQRLATKPEKGRIHGKNRWR